MFYNHPLLLIADLLLVMIMTIFVYVAWHFNSQFKGMREWFIAFSCAASNLLLYIFKLQIPPLVLSLLLQALLMSTGLFALYGCRRYVDKKISVSKAYIFIIIPTLAFSTYCAGLQSNPQIGFLITSIVTGCFFIIAGFSLLRGGFKSHPIRYALSLCILLHGLFMIWRPILFTPLIEGLLKQLLSIGGFEFILFQQIIFTPVLALSIILLVNEDNSRRLRIQAEYDSLTCLRNRGSFFSQLRKAANLSSRLKTPLTILTIDLDRFKSINDRYGHQAGDEVLKSFSRIAEQCIRNVDGIGRIGGEEFSIYLMNTSIDSAKIIAERLRNAIETSPVKLSSGEIHYSASIGIASYEEQLGIDSVIDLADRALYQAKQNGRNRVELASKTELAI